MNTYFIFLSFESCFARYAAKDSIWFTSPSLTTHAFEGGKLNRLDTDTSDKVMDA